MDCRAVRDDLLLAEEALGVEVSAHLQACPACSAVAAGLGRLDGALRSTLVAAAPRAVEAGLQPVLDAVERLDVALSAALRPELPPTVEARLATLVPEPAAVGERLEATIRAALVVEPPAELQQRLVELVPPAEAPWVVGWRWLTERPAVLAGQLAALVVLAYASVQLLGWVGSAPIVLGDVPYAIELLVLSPALTYMASLESLVQQLGLWLLVGAAGWLLTQGLTRTRQPAP